MTFNMFLQANQPGKLYRAVTILVQVFPRLLGLMFLYAAVLKSIDRTNLQAVLKFDGFSRSISPVLAWIVIASEGLLGSMLIGLSPRKWLLGAAAGMLAIYTGQLIVLVASDGAPDCGCMQILTLIEQQQRDRHDNIMGLSRNIVLLLALAATWLQVPPRNKHPRSST
ncbi:MAG TPA: MauE/DoxX family redox-associated membrane protein [Tepidisphaeraceae bacterium]|nr:MauE/DoxX family redox-associated membrane protein [Tepidisphaeraceae bacterium]